MKPYYEDKKAGITIYHGDCREILPHLPKVDFVLTDPPFEKEAHTNQRRLKRSGVIKIEPLPLPFPPMSEDLREHVAGLISEKCKKWILTFCQIEVAGTWRTVYESKGLVYKRTCIWVKPDSMPQFSGDRPGMGYETFVAMHGPGKSRWNGGGRRGVFIVNKGEYGGQLAPHPTTKPLKLFNQIVSLFSDKDNFVLDPFMGSGTTLRAAKDLGRKAIGIEIEEKYCEIAAKRLAQ